MSLILEPNAAMAGHLPAYGLRHLTGNTQYKSTANRDRISGSYGR